MSITIKDVARKAGVAVGTVSRVVNHHPEVNSDLRAHVLRVVDEMNYRPNVRAQILARNSSPIISFILSNRDFLHPFHSHALQGVEEYCEGAGYFVVYTRFRYSAELGAAALQLPGVLQAHGIADCVILAGTNYENFLTVLEKRKIQSVLLANNYISPRKREAFDQVRFDDFAGAIEATRYLIQLGHKDIWYIGDTSLPWYLRRYQGYEAAMREANLSPRAQTLGLSDDRFLNGLQSIGMIFERKLPITAILAGEDDLAYGAWEGLRLQGLEVPRDISMIGFDDQRERQRIPALTSVRIDAVEVGRQLAKMAVAKIKAKNQRFPEVLLPAQLIKRETCRPFQTSGKKAK